MEQATQVVIRTADELAALPIGARLSWAPRTEGNWWQREAEGWRPYRNSQPGHKTYRSSGIFFSGASGRGAVTRDLINPEIVGSP